MSGITRQVAAMRAKDNRRIVRQRVKNIPPKWCCYSRARKNFDIQPKRGRL